MATYEIDGIEQSFELTTRGDRVDVMRVNFITSNGDNGRVVVPLAPGWQDEAVRLIKEQVQHYDDIYGSGQ